MRRISDARGFTLIELLVTLSLTGIVFIMDSMLFSYIVKAYWRNYNTCQLQQDAMYALEQISKEVKSSCILPDAITNSGRTLNLKSLESGSPTITITCGTINGSKVLKRIVSNNNIPVNTRVIINNADSIMFRYDSTDGALDIALTTCMEGTGLNYTAHMKLYSRVSE